MTSAQYFTISCVIAVLLVPQLIALYLCDPRAPKHEEYDYR